MTDNIITFPGNDEKPDKKQDVDSVLKQDPFYEFLLGLISAVDGAGLPLDKSPEEKAKQLYAKYQRENRIAQWKQQMQREIEEKKKQKARAKLEVVEPDSDSDSEK